MKRVLAASLAILLMGACTTEDVPSASPTASRIPRTAAPDDPTATPESDGMMALTGMIATGDGGVVLVGSDEPIGSPTTGDLVLAGVDSSGTVAWTRAWPNTDGWYTNTAPSPWGPSLAAYGSIRVLDEQGGTKAIIGPPGLGAGFDIAWMGSTLLVTKTDRPGITSAHGIESKLVAVRVPPVPETSDPGKIDPPVLLEGVIAWSEPLPQGMPELVGGVSSGFAALDNRKGEDSLLFPVTSLGLRSPVRFREQFLTVAETQEGVAVGTSVPRNSYRLLDRAGNRYAEGQISHADGWLDNIIPLADGNIAITANGEWQDGQGRTTITVVDGGQVERQEAVDTADPVAVWLSPDGGLIVAGTGKFAPDAVRITGDVWMVSLPPT